MNNKSFKLKIKKFFEYFDNTNKNNKTINLLFDDFYLYFFQTINIFFKKYIYISLEDNFFFLDKREIKKNKFFFLSLDKKKYLILLNYLKENSIFSQNINSIFVKNKDSYIVDINILFFDFDNIIKENKKVLWVNNLRSFFIDRYNNFVNEKNNITLQTLESKNQYCKILSYSSDKNIFFVQIPNIAKIFPVNDIELKNVISIKTDKNNNFVDKKIVFIVKKKNNKFFLTRYGSEIINNYLIEKFEIIKNKKLVIRKIFRINNLFSKVLIDFSQISNYRYYLQELKGLYSSNLIKFFKDFGEKIFFFIYTNDIFHDLEYFMRNTFKTMFLDYNIEINNKNIDININRFNFKNYRIFKMNEKCLNEFFSNYNIKFNFK